MGVFHSAVRCGWRGWKFDVTGACLDLPNLPNLPEKTAVLPAPCLRLLRCAAGHAVVMFAR
jgi:nitrite reductase/ring-hydroxylating ferredoxin subunit